MMKIMCANVFLLVNAISMSKLLVVVRNVRGKKLTGYLTLFVL